MLERGFFLGVVSTIVVYYGLRKIFKIAGKSRKSAMYHGGMCRLRPGMLDQYTQLHDHTWDQVMERMYKSNMRNFTVYFHAETNLMFSHWEYVGSHFEADMQKISEDPIVKLWWSYCEPCQDPLHWDGPPPSQGGSNGNWWEPLVCVNHCGAWPTEYSSVWPHPDFMPQNPQHKTSTIDTPPDIHNRDQTFQ